MRKSLIRTIYLFLRLDVDSGIYVSAKLHSQSVLELHDNGIDALARIILTSEITQLVKY